MIKKKCQECQVLRPESKFPKSFGLAKGVCFNCRQSRFMANSATLSNQLGYYKGTPADYSEDDELGKELVAYANRNRE